MNINQNIEPVRVCPIQQIIDIVEGSVKASSDIGSVGLVHVITDGQTQRVDRTGLCEVANNLFRDPILPMVAELSVPFFGPQDFTKCVNVKGS